MSTVETGTRCFFCNRCTPLLNTRELLTEPPRIIMQITYYMLVINTAHTHTHTSAVFVGAYVPCCLSAKHTRSTLCYTPIPAALRCNDYTEAHSHAGHHYCRQLATRSGRLFALHTGVGTTAALHVCVCVRVCTETLPKQKAPALPAATRPTQTHSSAMTNTRARAELARSVHGPNTRQPARTLIAAAGVRVSTHTICPAPMLAVAC